MADVPVPEWWFGASALLFAVVVFGAMIGGLTIYTNGEESVVYQTKDVVVVRGNPKLPDRLRIYFDGDKPTADDVAVLAKALDEYLLGDGEHVNRDLLDRLLMRSHPSCPDGGEE